MLLVFVWNDELLRNRSICLVLFFGPRRCLFKPVTTAKVNVLVTDVFIQSEGGCISTPDLLVLTGLDKVVMKLKKKFMQRCG